MKINRASLSPVATVLALLTGCPSGEPMGGTAGSGTDTEPTTSADSTDGAPSDCGNDVIDGDEQCDGAELGGASCTDVNPAYTGGTLSCGASCTFDASACELPPGTALVALNEVTSDSVQSGRFAGPNDAIELHNAGNADADLSGWQLSDDPTLPAAKTYVFPAGTTLAAGEFMVLLSVDATTMTGDLPFGLNNSGEETLTLADDAGGVVDSVLVDGYLARVSYCRLPDVSGPWFQCEQTFGELNMLADTACGNGMAEDAEECDGADLAGGTCEGLGVGYSGGTVSCSPTCRLDAEACTTTSDLVLNELNASTDDIEIFNGGGAAVDMSGWILTDDEVRADYDPNLDMAELVFPAGTVLAPGAYLVVSLGLGPGQHPFGLGLMGDTITLAEPSPITIIDQVTYGAGEATVSYCRLPNGPGNPWMPGCNPTMGAAN